MTNNSLFFLVFFSQIILISYYYPKQILQRVSYVFKNYPSSEYPKLYNKEPGYFESGVSIFKVLNHIILVSGLLLICGVGYWAYGSDANVNQGVPFAFWVLQVIPMALMEFTGFAYFKLMRESNKRSKRSAPLVPRRLFDFVSPSLFVFTIVMNIVCVLFFYYINDFSFSLSNDTFVILLVLAASNFLYGFVIWFNLRGAKLDPFQTTADRLKQISISIKSMFIISIVASVFLMLLEGIDHFNLDYLESTLMSVYLQLIIVLGLGSQLRKNQIEDINFEVYKKDESII